MNNLKFYIYGVPDGFDMLSGTPATIPYFQLFYDTNKKGKEMRIHRKANGETIYSYLVYNLVSSKNREGAFLGMSIAFFDHEYCSNPVDLRSLFEVVYNELILNAEGPNKIITRSGDTLKYCISKFGERREECDKIGRIILNNLQGVLAADITKADEPFDNSIEGRIVNLPIDADNESIMHALRLYTWVSLSSEVKLLKDDEEEKNVTTKLNPEQPKDLLTAHYINELSERISSYKDFIIQGWKELATAAEISSKNEEIHHYLDVIEEYESRQSAQLTDLKKQYESLYNEIVELKKKKRVPEDNKITNRDGREDNNDWLKLIRTHFPKIIAGSVILIIVLTVIFLWPTGNKQGKEVYQRERVGIPKDAEPESRFNNSKFKSYLDQAQFNEAWEMIQNETGIDSEMKKSLENKVQMSFQDWLSEQIKQIKKADDGKKLVESINNEYTFNREKERNIATIEDQIKRLSPSKPTPAPDPLPPLSTPVIHIYTADINYTKGEHAVIQNNVIKCKKGAHFIVTGATENLVSSNPKAVACWYSSQDPEIKTIECQGLGKSIITINQNQYTFLVER